MGLEVTNSDEQTFALYRPTSFTHSCFVSHPDEIFETSSMSCLPPPKTGYQLNLCSQTILRGFLTNAQLEAISLACAQHDLRLHGTGERAAFFLGDGPGVGKGRASVPTHRRCRHQHAPAPSATPCLWTLPWRLRRACRPPPPATPAALWREGGYFCLRLQLTKVFQSR